MIPIDLTGKRALVAGIAEDSSFGFAIAKRLAEAGASIVVGTWPPAFGMFSGLLRRGKLDEARQLSGGGKLEFERIYPFDAAYDSLDQVPESVRTSKRYAERGDFTISGLAAQLVRDFGEKPIDYIVHSIANAPEAKNKLLETSRNGYLTAISVSAYSMVSMIRLLGPLVRPGGAAVSLTYLASERIIPGYGGGMHAAKAALESDNRVLAFEAWRKFALRVNTISAGPYASRAASVTGTIDEFVEYYRANSPVTESVSPLEVANSALFLLSPLSTGVSGTTVYVDKGYHVMGRPVPPWYE